MQETFLQFAERTCRLQGQQRMGSEWVRYAMPGDALPDYLHRSLYGRRLSDPPTANWPEFWAYLVAAGAPPNVIAAADKAWRAWLRYLSRGVDPRQLDLFTDLGR
jgi:hypothetical protein